MNSNNQKYHTYFKSKLDEDAFRTLAQHHDIVCFSIYYPLKEENNRDKKRLEEEISSLIEKEVSDYKEIEIRKDEILNQLKEQLHDLEIGNLMNHSLAIFISKHFSAAYVVPEKLRKTIYVNQHFYLKIIAPLFNPSNQFLLLYFHHRQSRIYEINNNELHRLAIIKNKDGKKFIHENSDYLRTLISKLELIKTSTNRPLVLATNNKNLDELKRLKCLNQEFKHTIILSGGKLDLRMLRSKILSVGENIRKEIKTEFLHMLNKQASNPKLIKEKERILVSAEKGQLGALFLRRGKDLYGEYDRFNSYVFQSDENKGVTSLSNLAAVETILNGGNVYLLDEKEMPANNSLLSAVLKNQLSN